MKKHILFFKEILIKKPYLIKVTIIALVIIVAFFVTMCGDEEGNGIIIESNDSLEKTEEIAKEILEVIVVDVGGAVNMPGVIELPQGSRVYEAIEKAGGITKEGDLSQINQAILLNDGDKLYVPNFQELKEKAPSSYNSSNVGIVSNESKANGKININTASQEQLETISGVGPVTAGKIIEYRRVNGDFHAIENIIEVPGIGEKTFETLKNSICI